MGLFDYMRYAAQANQQPDMGTLQWGGATPAPTLQQPQNNSLSSFSPDSLEGYIASNLDYDNLRGGMWSDPNYGARGTVADMANYLRKAGFNSGADFQSFDPTKDPARWLSLSQVDGNNGWTRLIPNATGGRRFGNGFAGEGGTQYYVDYDQNAKKYKFSTKGIETSDKEAIMGALMSVGLVAGAAGIGGALGGAGTGAATTGAATTGAGTAAELGMAGFGQIGIPSAIPAGTGFGTLGATSLAAPVSTFGGAAIGGGMAGTLAGMGAAGGMGGAGSAGAAGVTDLGGGLSMGADGAITGATGLNPSTLSNAGIMESVGYGGAGTATMGAGGSGGGAGGAEAITGTPPPANPYHPASYLSPTNLSNLATSGGASSLLGPAASVLGAISGGQGQEGSSSSTKTMDPRMDALFYGDLAPKTQGLLSSTLPGAQAAGQQLTAKGSGLLGQTAPNTATNPYATGILDDMQRRQQELISRSLQQTKGNFVGTGGLGGSRQGIAEADAITRGADNFAGQGFNFMGGLYNADQNRLRQDWTLGAGLMGQGVDTPFQPAKNTAQIYSPFTGFGTTTNNTQQGGGWQGAVGGALAGASFGRNMGWW